MRWRRFALDGGVLKKRGGWRWGGSLKKPDVIRSPRNKRQKKLGSPSAVGVFGTPHRQVQGPRKEMSWKVLEGCEGCDAACDRAWSSRSKEFPGSCLMLLNVINPWDVRASLLKETGRATGEVALSTHTYAYIRVKINQHTSPASTIP